MTQGDAEDLAVQALGWLASQPEAMSSLLGASGASVEDLRARSGDPDFLGFVLDHVLAEDWMVLDFAENAKIAPQDVLTARAALPGGALPNWT